ncbi:MAG TPA: helix-turn-helix domain-containing protein [Thermoanaerobaculia bacterium]|nr:helix-turn-helix domain-containing protein [Thermoanaerobaculia bacterium]
MRPPSDPPARRLAPPGARPHRVAALTFAGGQILDVTGPLEVFSRAERLMREEGRATEPVYQVEVLARTAGPVAMSSGIELVARRSLHTTVAIDTLIVCGGIGTDAALADRELIAWLRRQQPRVDRLASVCTGALLLAEAGLLDGRRATTHWSWCDRLARDYPRVDVVPDAIYVRDGGIYTSAGVTAGIDLALAMVEEDWGREVALGVARELVVFLKRPGGQSQFSRHLSTLEPASRPIRELELWALDNLAADLSVEALADRVHMSPRNFARVFRRESGTTPAKFVEVARVEEARRRLEETPLTTAAIATGCGFGTTESMRRAFLRHLGIGPAEYRRRFSPSSLEPSRAIAARDDSRRVALVRRRSALADAGIAN